MFGSQVYLQWADYLKSDSSASKPLEILLSVLLFFHRTVCRSVLFSVSFNLLHKTPFSLPVNLHSFKMQLIYVFSRFYWWHICWITLSFLYTLSVYSSQCRKMLSESQTFSNCNLSNCHWFILCPCGLHKTLLKLFLVFRVTIIAAVATAKFIKHVSFISLL